METHYVLWEGPSRLDGSPIVAIITGLERPSTNRKTGPVAQVWILTATTDPVTATRTGADKATCGECPLRPALAVKGAPRCYVAVFRGPQAVQRAYREGFIPHAEPADIGAILARRRLSVRLGAYGDPAAVPHEVWRDLLAAGATWTGYTHQWRRPEARPLRSILMASVDSPQERREAIRQGWRTFRIRKPGETLRTGEITCPASKEAGQRTACAYCRLCDGRKRGDRRKTVAIIDHGPTGPESLEHMKRIRALRTT